MILHAEEATIWDKEQLFLDGDSFFNHLLKDISHAKSSIEIETYIFDWDEIGEKFANALIEASQRNVNVRLMVDGFGSMNSVKILKKTFKESKVKFKIYHPILLKMLIKFSSTLNKRNHKKVFICDNRLAYVGSINITKWHLNSIVGETAWKDCALRVEGKEVTILKLAFFKAWAKGNILKKEFYLSWLERIKIKKFNLVRLNDTILKRKFNYSNLLERVKNAKKDVLIMNAYFSPRHGIVNTLIDKARSGLPIRILVPKHSDVMFMSILTSTYYYELLEAGVSIYEYIPSMLHAKVTIIDDWVILGSSNMNHRSFLYDLEADVEVSAEENKHKLREEIFSYFEKSELVTIERLKKVSWWFIILARYLKFFRSWV